PSPEANTARNESRTCTFFSSPSRPTRLDLAYRTRKDKRRGPTADAYPMRKERRAGRRAGGTVPNKSRGPPLRTCTAVVIGLGAGGWSRRRARRRGIRSDAVVRL